MALTESNMLPLGSSAPDFELPDTASNTITREQFSGNPLLVVFMCNHCPYVKHIAPELAKIGHEYTQRGVGMVAIQSNDVAAYPDDDPDKMRDESEARGYVFPYCHDKDQSVALAYTAACTPDFFLFDAKHKLVYRGRLDETRPTRIRSGVYDSTGHEPHGKDLRAALEAALSGNQIDPTQYPSLGCNIKWKPENDPNV